MDRIYPCRSIIPYQKLIRISVRAKIDAKLAERPATRDLKLEISSNGPASNLKFPSGFDPIPAKQRCVYNLRGFEGRSSDVTGDVENTKVPPMFDRNREPDTLPIIGSK